MATIQLAGGPVGGVVQGVFGTYNQAADGTFTVDTRDAPSLLAAGMVYVSKVTESYNTPIAPAAATAGRIVASGALSNGAVAIANQPDVLRPVNLVIGTGTVAVTAGNVAITYAGNDGLSTTENYTAVVGASASTTTALSRGVARISTIVVSALAGGATPYIRMDTTAGLSVPVEPAPVDFILLKETLSTGDEAPGTVQTATIGSITPTTAPNGTLTYSFVYNYVSPTA